MIGLIYADYTDPKRRFPFHGEVCRIFTRLAKGYPTEIRARVDPYVTARGLRWIFSTCDFVFYWGHGLRTGKNGPVLWGSSARVVVPLRDLLPAHLPRQCFLDACEIGVAISDDAYRQALIASPAGEVYYRDSVRMGCEVMSCLLSGRHDFRQAISIASQRLGLADLYHIAGKAQPQPLYLSEDARASVLEAFASVLNRWEHHNS